MMREEYASIRATPSLVGREDILNQVHEAIQNRSSIPFVFYITAPGGWGKTRLVDAILKKLDANEEGDWGSPSILSASRLVDLYHTYTHSDEGLVEDIVNVLDAKEGGRFENYINQRAELDRVKHDLSQILRTVTLQRTKMMEAFIEDFNNNSDQYEKIVLAFDTVENLTYEPDRVQIALGLAEEPIGVAGWLVKGFLPNIRNAVVLIAGRPETPQLEAELVKLSKDKKIFLDHIELQTFSEEETLAYFEAVLAVVREENPRIAERLERTPQETRLVVHYLSGGEPFLLSLFVDYLATAERLLPLIQTPLPEIKQKSEAKSGLKVEREEFREAILEEFQKIGRPFDDVIRTLAWTEKGMGAVLLAWILKRDQPTEEEIEQAKKYVDELRNPELRLSFVKIREIDRLVFLQDEMYKLMRSLHQRGRVRHNAKQTYELIAKFYEERIKEQTSVVNKLDKSTRSLFSSGTWKDFTEVQKKSFFSEQKELRHARARLQSYQVEHVYYCLQADYIQGIQAYYRVAEGAFQSSDTNLWLLLRDELLKFAKQRSDSGNEKDEEVLRYIYGDIGVRWIKHTIAEGNHKKAKKQISDFRKGCPDLLQEGSFSDISLKIWESFSLTLSGKEYTRAEQILNTVFDSLKNGVTDKFEDEFDEWRLKLLKAYANDKFGYLYRSKGDYAKAVENYRRNIRLWRELHADSEYANTLNNLSWVLAELGDFQSAIRNCEDSLNLRRKLGHRYPIALSLNTLGLIEARYGLPERAVLRCEQALIIFRDLEQPRGIGLACSALAESLRRMTNVSDLLTDESSVENLKIAEKRAKESVEIFTNIIDEPLRLVEAYLELGCIYREMARRLKSDKTLLKNLINESKSAFKLSMQNAEIEYSYRRVDALVNLAWLYYYVGDFDQASKTIDDMEVDDRCLFKKNYTPIMLDGLVPWHWVQLGKANLLLGIIAFDKYENANMRKDSNEAKKQLMEVGQYWTFSMAYNELFGNDFRDLKKGRQDIYNRLRILNLDEMGWLKDGVNQVIQDYGKTPKLLAFEKFLVEQFD